MGWNALHFEKDKLVVALQQRARNVQSLLRALHRPVPPEVESIDECHAFCGAWGGEEGVRKVAGAARNCSQETLIGVEASPIIRQSQLIAV